MCISLVANDGKYPSVCYQKTLFSELCVHILTWLAVELFMFLLSSFERSLHTRCLPFARRFPVWAGPSSCFTEAVAEQGLFCMSKESFWGIKVTIMLNFSHPDSHHCLYTLYFSFDLYYKIEIIFFSSREIIEEIVLEEKKFLWGNSACGLSFSRTNHNDSFNTGKEHGHDFSRENMPVRLGDAGRCCCIRPCING